MQAKDQDWWKLLDEAIANHEVESVEWFKECEADIAESGNPLGDGKELRRARNWIINVVKEIEKNATKA